MKLSTILVLASFAGACASAPTQSAPSPDASAARWADSAAAPTLYGRDGNPVQSAPASESDPRHDVAPADGSRMHLLEIYQRTVEEKEALAREVEGLQSALTHSAETQSALEKERDAARADVERLQRELAAAKTDNADLAGRLVTAQIRRLEAEKLLLETRIDVLRREGAVPASAPVEQAPSKGASKSSAHSGSRD